MIQKYKDKIGEINCNNNGNNMEIIEFNNHNDILVKFGDGSIVKTNYGNFKIGSVKSFYDKTICGVGYLGEGKYEAYNGKNPLKHYTVWRTMIRRCYYEDFLQKEPAYRGCTVVPKWHNFQVFSKWYYENIYEIKGQNMQLDKDIIHKGNKIYSPENCIFVPQEINLLFITRKAERSKDGLGISTNKGDLFRASYKGKHLGTFKTKEEAFNTYKSFKEKAIKDMADKYKSQIPNKLYEALYNYNVEVND